MQRASRTLPLSCRLGTALLRPRGSMPRLKGQISTTLRQSTPLLAFDFLHPPIVRQAVHQARRLEQQIRRYTFQSDDNDRCESAEVEAVEEDGDPPYGTEIWTSSKLAPLHKGGDPPADTEEWSAKREDEGIRDKLDEPPEEFSEPELHADLLDDVPITDWIPSPSESEQAASDPDYCAHLVYPAAKALFNYEPEQFRSTEPFYVPPAIKDVVQKFVTVIHNKIPRQQHEMIDLYRRHALQNVLPAEYKFHLSRYLYISTRRQILTALLDLGLGGRLTVPTLCRLGRLDEAREITLANLYASNAHPIRLDNLHETLTVLDEYAKGGDWERLLEFWEKAVMAPVVQDPSDIMSAYFQNSMLENCLVLRAPNIKDWYYRKASSIILTPDADPKLREFIKNVGAVLVKGFAKNRRGVEGLDLVKYITSSFGEIETISYFWELHALRKEGRPHLAMELYVAQKKREFELTMHFAEVDEEQVKHHLLNIQNEAMASASALNNFPVLREIFEDLYKLGLEPSAYSYAIVMHAFARHGQADTVQRLFDMYARTGKPMSIYLYAELLYVHVMLLDIPAVEKTFQLIRESGVDINLIIYDILISAYARTRDVDSALRIFRVYMKEVGKPDLGIINHLINTFANRNDPDAAVEMFNLIGQYNLTPGIHSFNSLLNAYANTDDDVNAEAVIAKMRELGVEPDVITWTTLLKIYARRQDSHGIIDGFARMRRLGVQPNEVTWNVLMQAIAFSGSPKAHENVRRVMNRVKALGYKLTVFHWNAYLIAATRATQDLQALQDAYDEMIRNGIKPNTMTNLILVTSYCQLGGPAGQDVAEGIISRLTSIQHHVDLTSPFYPKTSLPPTLFEPIFKVQGPKLPLEQVQRVFDAFVMSAASIGGSPAEPNLELLNQLLDVYRKHGDLEACKRTWKAIKHHADTASRSFHAMQTDEQRDFVAPGNKFMLGWSLDRYLLALSESNQLDEIDRVWDELVENGYDFTCQNWNTRIQICIWHKKHIVWAFRACEQVLIDGWEKRFQAQRRRLQNPPKRVREARRQRNEVKYLNRVFWPIEDDVLDLKPYRMFEKSEEPEKVVEYFIHVKTLVAFLVLRRSLLMGASIVDSSGRIRPGPEVWDRLKTAFPRLVRAMFIQLKKMSAKKRQGLTKGLEAPIVRYAQSG